MEHFKLNLYNIFWLFSVHFFPLPHWTHALLLLLYKQLVWTSTRVVGDMISGHRTSGHTTAGHMTSGLDIWTHDIWTTDIWTGHLDTGHLDTWHLDTGHLDTGQLDYIWTQYIWTLQIAVCHGVFLACMPVHLCNVMYITVLVLMLGCHFTIFIFSADITNNNLHAVYSLVSKHFLTSRLSTISST